MDKPNNSEKVNRLLSDIVVNTKYARYDHMAKRRETWGEIVTRNFGMHLDKYKDKLDGDDELRKLLWEAYELVHKRHVLPSMRSLQFAGKPIFRHPNRVYNCAYAPVDHPKIFGEITFLLLGGTGVGYSVQKKHVRELPCIAGPAKRKRRFLIPDSVEGWADAVQVLMDSYFHGKSTPIFDYSDIREQGAPLVTSGGRAPGPEPLKRALQNITRILDRVQAGERLTPLQAHDIICHAADMVISGGVRRSALIALFSFDDEEMLECKAGEFWRKNPQRAMANNSVVALRHRVKKADFDALLKRVEIGNAGEPGIIFSNDADYGVNPCAEISLRPYSFCNLTEINASDIENEGDFLNRCKAAAVIGTLQAGYTDFNYLRPCWQEATEKDALIGVGLTGIASNRLTDEMLERGVNCIRHYNELVANKIDIKTAARLTTVKPSGTTSLVLGCSSGIHAWYSNYYIRTLRYNKDEPIYEFLKTHVPSIVEDDAMKPSTSACVRIPVKAEWGCTTRAGESMLEFLDRVKRFNDLWIRNGHNRGHNRNNVSATVSVRPQDWELLGEWMWRNREYYSGLSIMPYDERATVYEQAPHETINENQYYYKVGKIVEEIERLDIDVHRLLELNMEEADRTDRQGEVSCQGGACEI